MISLLVAPIQHEELVGFCLDEDNAQISNMVSIPTFSGKEDCLARCKLAKDTKGCQLTGAHSCFFSLESVGSANIKPPFKVTCWKFILDDGGDKFQ